jgi:vesicle-fusing ATPase
MSGLKPVPVHADNTFEDLSGISTSAFSNPYDALIAACEDDPVGQSMTSVSNKY